MALLAVQLQPRSGKQILNALGPCPGKSGMNHNRSFPPTVAETAVNCDLTCLSVLSSPMPIQN